MPWIDEKNAGHLLTAVALGGSAWNGVLGARLSVSIMRDPKRAGGRLTPRDRSVLQIDAQFIVRFLDQASVKTHTTSPANIVATLLDGNGNSANVTCGTFVAGSYDHIFEAGQGGMPLEQVCELEAATLTYSTGF